MKVLDAPLSVTKNFISPEPREQSFRIAVTSKAFQILSSGVYTDKIAAVIRELGTNAADSHVAAGKPDVPFRVHVPTALEPWFAVHDEGIGMDEDDIYSTYTEYFNSDKTHTNALTGCLGIGSKSPFAYTDQFTVAATKDGVKRTFTAYLSEKKIPTLTKVDERKTRASNGVIITVPVKACDIEEFEAKCTEIYFWFGHKYSSYQCKPLLLSDTDGSQTSWLQRETTPRLTKPIIIGDDYEYGEVTGRKDAYRYRYYADTFRVVMGNVAYMINADDIGYDSSRDEAGKRLAKSTLTLYLPMGDENDQAVIEPAASRESIQLTDAGCALLRKKISTITNHIQADVQAKVGACSNLWEARRLLQSAGDLHNLLVNTLRVTFTCFDYKGTKVNTGGTGTPLPGNLLTCRVYSNHRAYRRRNSGYTWTIKLDYPASLPFSAEHVFYSFGEHEPPNASQRIRAYTAEFRNTAPATEVYWLIVKPGQKKEFEEFIQREGLDKVVKATTELPEKELDEDKPKVRARRSASVPAAQLLTLDRQTCESKTAAWRAGTGTLPAEACYVEVLNYDWRLTHNTSFTHPRVLAATLALLDKCKDVPPVYGVRRQLLPKIEVQQPKWMPLKEYLDDFVTKNADKLWQGYLPATCDLSRVTGGRQITLFVAIADKVSKSLPKTSPLLTAVKQYQALVALTNDPVTHFVRGYDGSSDTRYLYMPDELTPAKQEACRKKAARMWTDVANAFSDLEERYPLITAVCRRLDDRYYHSVDDVLKSLVDNFADYVLLQEKELKRQRRSKK